MMKRIALGILVIGVLLSACTGDASMESVGIDAEEGTDGRVAATATTTAASGATAEDEAAGGGSGDAVLAGRKIIRQGSLILQDDDPEAVLRQWLAENAGVYINPGSSYGTGGAGRMRMNSATPRSLLQRGLANIATALA